MTEKMDTPRQPRMSWLDRSGKPARGTSGRRPRAHLLAGLLLVVLCVGGAVWWSTSLLGRTQVLAVARPVTTGHVLSRADLRSIEVGAEPDAALIPADTLDQVLGRPMATTLGAGALLSPDAVTTSPGPVPGHGVVAIGVRPGQYPPEIAVGAAVTLVAINTPDTPAGAVPPASAGASWQATVVGLAPGDTDMGAVASVMVDSGNAVRLAQIPPGHLAVVLRPMEGER